MPAMDGHELVGLMRGEEGSLGCADHLPPRAAYGQEERSLQGYSTGAVDCLIKPGRIAKRQDAF